MRNLVITRKATGPIAVNKKVYNIFQEDKRFDFIESSKASDYDIQIRFVRFKSDIGEYEVLATSLQAETFTVDHLKEIYHLRWNIKTSYLLSKGALGMASYHSIKSENVQQDFFVNLIIYNFVMYICSNLKTDNRVKKHRQQINFTQSIKICLCFFRESENPQTFDVEATILKSLLPVRQGLSYQRKAISKTVISFNYRLT